MIRCAFLVLLCALIARAAIVTGHDYDPVSDSVVSWRIAPGASAGQSITIPAGVTSLSGFRVRLQRFGSPADLEFRLGSRRAHGDIASGRLPSRPVSPWFEHWSTVRFRKPAAVTPGAHVFLELHLAAGSPGAYELFGTATEPIPRPEFHSRFQYIANVNPEEAPNTTFENPVNLDYGARTPRYDGGSAFDSAGALLIALDFAFQFYQGQPPAAEGEERFAFIEEITGPLFPARLRDAAAKPARGEVALDATWRIVAASPAGEPAVTASVEFREFLRLAMGISPGAAATHTLRLATACPGLPARSESFRLKVAAGRIDLCGYDARGLMQGLHYLEARMRLRRAPILTLGEETRQTVQSPRVTSAPFYSRSELDAPFDPYTPGLLGRISRAGFNAIWVWGDIEDVAHSAVYPELDQEVARRQARLGKLIERAAHYGIDVYLQLGNRPQTPEFFARHPGVQGTAMRWYGGSHALCTSVPEVREHYRAAARNLMSAVPGLKGFVYIVGGEGFLHCWTRNIACPRCSKRTPQEVIAEFSRALFEGARQGNPTAAVAFWPYSASNSWSRDDTTQSRLIARMPAGITLLTEDAKEAAVTFGGITIPAYDYPISVVGPSDRFQKQAALAASHSLGFWAKTEHAISLEFVDVPYIPVFFQFAERFRRLREFPGVTAQFDNWMHYGFMPSLAADVFYWNIWSTPAGARELLTALARRDFGAAAAPSAVAAWESFSAAIREYPFSGAMAMGPIQKGPSHPPFFDAAYNPAHDRGRQFKNDLSWTRPWGPALTIAQLTKMQKLWSTGVASMQQAVEHAEPELRVNARRELGVARALEAAIASTRNVALFYQAREQGDRPRMRAIAEAELQNARAVLPFIANDSRLGYANSGRNDQEGVPRAGIYSPGAIRQKIDQVQKLLDEQLRP
ncbi:MAG: hypothetical protein NTY38_14345 [Acidobacteria bacterium]|nr:hypothetical protein [Acidobacteriota bacterium]